MMGLFPALPIQRPPRSIMTGAHALLRCGECCGYGEVINHWDDGAGRYVTCPKCSGGGVRLVRLCGDGRGERG
jgi:hypothetical protein